MKEMHICSLNVNRLLFFRGKSNKTNFCGRLSGKTESQTLKITVMIDCFFWNFTVCWANNSTLLSDQIHTDNQSGCFHILSTIFHTYIYIGCLVFKLIYRLQWVSPNQLWIVGKSFEFQDFKKFKTIRNRLIIALCGRRSWKISTHLEKDFQFWFTVPKNAIYSDRVLNKLQNHWRWTDFT